MNKNCYTCHDTGINGWSNGEDFDTEFCLCPQGVKLENEYAEWYASNELNEYSLETENA
jgi:hypothetical protein